MPTIRTLLRANRGSIFETYTKIDEAIRNWNNVSPPWVEKQRPSRTLPPFSPDCIDMLDLTNYTNEQQAAIAELRAARELKAIKDAETARKAEEEENFAHAKSIGEVVECGCCFDEFPLNRMIHCNGENCHWFCRNCMKKQAETNVGVSKYEITCMSTDGCAAGFSTDQKKQFLNKKLRVALGRLEQEAALRMAGIENLENCPFCPYAAECPPIEVDKEFTCVNPGCEKVSCRMCHKETHIPKTCAEASRDQGLDARHVVEEAMSEALIRRCNECQTPYLKLNGCNKIYCTKCSNIQCYVCRQTIADYGHFDDARRGGKSGQCPLFDKTEERHQQEVQQAEEKVRQKMLKDHADITEDTLKINLSEQVLQDDQKRKKESLQQHPHPNLFANALDVNNGINRAARQYHQPNQPGANRRAVPPPMFYHIPPPPPHLPRHLPMHPPAQPIGVPGGPQARNRAVRAVIPMLPVPNQQGQQLPPIQQQLPGLGARAPPQGMVAAGHVPGGMVPVAPMAHPMGPPLGAPQAQQEAIQQRMENLFRLAPIRQQGPPVLQNGVLNNLPQERPAERVDPLYHPVNRRNEFPNLQNANGFNFRRWGF
ncbi:hypothetical protein F4774DRAFT_165373 [Daldinia eschscholtzii]|nr:hypothetical protein F4774DRAFT_165373 [Daldinia eschscholtzii]